METFSALLVICAGNSPVPVARQPVLPGTQRYHMAPLMMTSLKGNIFRVTGHLCGEFTGKHLPRNWPFVQGIHRSPVNSPHKGQRRGALMFSLICVSINGWVNNREAGDLRRYHAHYDVTVMNDNFDIQTLHTYEASTWENAHGNNDMPKISLNPSSTHILKTTICW